MIFETTCQFASPTCDAVTRERSPPRSYVTSTSLAVDGSPRCTTLTVQHRVVARREHDVSHRRAGNCRRHQRPHQHARDGRVAVGKVKDVRIVVGPLPVPDSVAEIHTGKSRILVPIVLAAFVAIHRRDRLDAGTEEVVRPVLQIRQHRAVAAGMVRHEPFVADRTQIRNLLRRRKMRQIVDALGVQPDQIRLRAIRKRRVAKDVGPGRAVRARGKVVAAERLAAEGLYVEGSAIDCVPALLSSMRPST
jgi:hypothetical protein